MNTCYLLLPPIALNFQCGDGLWWAWLCFAVFMWAAALTAKVLLR